MYLAMNTAAAQSLRRLLAIVQAGQLSEQQDFVIADFANRWCDDLTRELPTEFKLYKGKETPKEKPLEAYVSKVTVEELPLDSVPSLEVFRSQEG